MQLVEILGMKLLRTLLHSLSEVSSPELLSLLSPAVEAPFVMLRRALMSNGAAWWVVRARARFCLILACLRFCCCSLRACSSGVSGAGSSSSRTKDDHASGTGGTVPDKGGELGGVSAADRDR